MSYSASDVGYLPRLVLSAEQHVAEEANRRGRTGAAPPAVHQKRTAPPSERTSARAFWSSPEVRMTVCAGVPT